MRTVHTLKYDQLRPSDAEALMGFHTDAGPSLQRIHPHSDSLPLQFKIQFFLTDLSEPDQANFMCGPGSHWYYNQLT